MDKNIWNSWPFWILSGYILIAVMAPVIANDKPLLCSCNGKWLMPGLFKSEARKWILAEPGSCTFEWNTIVGYGPQTTDAEGKFYSKPLSRSGSNSIHKIHWLGTDRLGRDVLANLIYGARTSLLIGFSAVLLAFMLGIPTGLVMGYYYNDKIRFNVFQLLFYLISGSIFVYILFYFSQFLKTGHFAILSIMTFMVVVIISGILGKLSVRKYFLPLDYILFRVIEVRKSIPGLLLLLAGLSLFSKPSAWNVIFIIGLLSWTEMARFIRAETLVVKNELYIMSARSMGISDFNIIVKYILPALMSSIIMLGCFSIAGAVLMESTLSFLGIGLPVEAASWGKMLAEARDLRAWWLAFFPGMLIFILIMVLHSLSQKISTQNNTLPVT